MTYVPHINWIDPHRRTRAYRTWIAQAADGTEQRQAIRSLPTDEESYTVQAMSAPDQAALMAWTEASLGASVTLPAWYDITELEDPVAASVAPVVLACDTTDRGFVVGGLCCLFTAPRVVECATITAVDAASVTVEALTLDWPRATMVLPARRGVLVDAVPIEWQGARVSRATLTVAYPVPDLG